MKSIRTLFFLLVGCKSALIYAMAQTYSPSNDANICVWFKADALGLTNNAAVSKWAPSAGGTNWTLQQTASNQQPIFQTSAQNGRSAVLFDGVSSFLTNSSPKLTASYQPYTIFLVYRYAGPLNAFQSYYLGNTPGVPSWFFGCRQGSNAVYAGGIGSIVPIDPNWHMVMLVVNGASSKYRIDGGPDTPLSGNPGTTPICSLEMGGQAGKASLARVYLGELLIYNGNQSANEAAIFNYLESRWAIIHLQQNPQFSFSWTDRRPIGMDILGGAEYVTASNPRGWFSKGGADVTTSNGLAAFRSKLLARAAIEVSILKSMNAQGVIVWDIEGQEIRGLTYFGDPTKLPVMAPEMDAVADDFFKMFTSAGLRVGLCLRPQTFGAGTSLPAGTNGDVFVKVNAKFGQKEYYYTNGWMLVTNVPAPVSAQSYQPELLDKVRYAKIRWGCSMFYIDSYGGLDRYGPTSVATLTNILQTFPNTLLAPECAFQLTLGQGTKMFAMSAPFLSPLYTGYFVPTNITDVYPMASALIYIASPYTNSASILASIRAGNIMLVNGWYVNPTVSLVQKAYAAALLKPPTGFLMLTNSP